MCANVIHGATYEHNVFDWEGGRLSRNRRENAAALDREGRLKPERTDTGRRMYSKAALDAFCDGRRL